MWESLSEYAALPFHAFLRDRPFDEIKEAIDLFGKYLCAPVSDWEEYRATGVRRRKRPRHELRQVGSTVAIQAIFDKMRRIEVEVGKWW